MVPRRIYEMNPSPANICVRGHDPLSEIFVIRSLPQGIDLNESELVLKSFQVWTRFDFSGDTTPSKKLLDWLESRTFRPKLAPFGFSILTPTKEKEVMVVYIAAIPGGFEVECSGTESLTLKTFEEVPRHIVDYYRQKY